ncbi:MAG: hypothetical protein KY468_10260 [Armatimonadetes bacterium]|nr:hypothetical protein [Armatimonadota bacterium]
MRFRSIHQYLLVWGALLLIGSSFGWAQTTPPTVQNPDVVMTDSSSAWVVFTTDVATKATVEYRSTNGATRTVTESGFDTGHAVMLSGLIQGLRYEGTITVTAENGATATAPLPPFTASPPQTDVQFEAAPEVFFTAPDEAVIAFATNAPSTARLDYGRNGNLDRTLRSDEPSRTHAFVLDGLLPNETYSYMVTIRGQDGSIVSTPPRTFKVAPPEQDLRIIEPEVFQTSRTTAWVIFRTTRPAKATVEVRSATGMVQTVSETDFETRHALLLSGLIFGQTYTVRIIATADNGDTAIAFPTPFTVTDVQRDIGFDIGPQVLVTAPNEAVVAFTTSEPSTARVDYGLNGNLTQTVREETPTTTHALTLTGLTPGATYTYVITVRAQDGSISSTAPTTFKVEPADGGVKVGDVDLDGFIDIRDVVLLLRYAIGILPLTLEQIEAADVDRNGQVNVTDAVRLLQIIVGIGT